jgi:hypothetical protein
MAVALRSLLIPTICFFMMISTMTEPLEAYTAIHPYFSQECYNNGDDSPFVEFKTKKFPEEEFYPHTRLVISLQLPKVVKIFNHNQKEIFFEIDYDQIAASNPWDMSGTYQVQAYAYQYRYLPEGGALPILTELDVGNLTMQLSTHATRFGLIVDLKFETDAYWDAIQHIAKEGLNHKFSGELNCNHQNAQPAAF